MKTKKQVHEEYPDYKRLINAVIRNIGKEAIQDVNNYGINRGFRGFIYYSDTVKFFKTYKNDIMKMAEELADNMGEDPFTMIKNFVCLNDNYSYSEIGEAIFNSKTDNSQIRNAMAWFAAKEVCMWFED